MYVKHISKMFRGDHTITLELNINHKISEIILYCMYVIIVDAIDCMQMELGGHEHLTLMYNSD